MFLPPRRTIQLLKFMDSSPVVKESSVLVLVLLFLKNQCIDIEDCVLTNIIIMKGKDKKL